MKRIVHIMLALTLAATAAMAADYRYVEPDLFKSWISQGKKMTIVDIQVPAEFRKRHFKGSLETGAFPAKSNEDRQKLDKVLPVLSKNKDVVVIICPRGGSGAKGTYDYLKDKGVEEQRLFILKGGMQGWPHKETGVVAE